MGSKGNRRSLGGDDRSCRHLVSCCPINPSEVVRSGANGMVEDIPHLVRTGVVAAVVAVAVAVVDAVVGVAVYVVAAAVAVVAVAVVGVAVVVKCSPRLWVA